MSKETLSSLNNNVLVGFTSERGKAWHYREELQGDESNSYDGAIPVGDVHRRLLNWQAESHPVLVNFQGTLSAVEGKQAIVRSDTGHVMGIFTNGYKIHQYDQWLLNTVSNILGDTLNVSAAGLLKNGAQAWVEVSVPETMHREGVAYRPNLLAATSHDGTLSTTFKRTVTMTVCDNTMGAALAESGQQLKIRHSVNSLNKLSNARDALQLLEQSADDFESELDEMLSIKVSPRQFDKFLDLYVPVLSEGEASKAAMTRAETKRGLIIDGYHNDPRNNEWEGTAFGIVQTVNTYAHHSLEVRGASRVERNMSNMVTGKFDGLTAETMSLVSLAVS